MNKNQGNKKKLKTKAKNIGMNAQFDESWKFGVIFYFPLLIKIFFPKLYDDIDWTQKFIEVSTENVRKSMKDIGGFEKQIADLAFRVFLKSRQNHVIIHVDIQATPQDNFSARITSYNRNLANEHGRRVISIAILVDKDLSWDPGSTEDNLHGDIQSHVYLILKLLNEVIKSEYLRSEDNPIGWFFLAHFVSRDTENNPKLRLEEKVRWTIEFSKSKILQEKDKQAIFQIFDGLLRLPKDLQQQFYERIKFLEGDTSMELITQTMVDFRNLGRKEGKKEGLKEGKKEGLLEGLSLALRLKFGKSAAPLLAILPKVKKLETLEAIFQAIEEDKTIQQILELAKE